MLRVRVCAAPIWVGFGSKIIYIRVLFGQIFLKHGCAFQKLAKNCKKLVAFAKIHHKSGYDGNCR